MTKKERYTYIIEYFGNNMPEAETELKYNNAFELLVAVILSAQCTDKRVNMVTPALFKKFPDSKKMAKADFEEVFKLIKSISYPNNKAKHLIGMAYMLNGGYCQDLVNMIFNYPTLAEAYRVAAFNALNKVFKGGAIEAPNRAGAEIKTPTTGGPASKKKAA